MNNLNNQFNKTFNNLKLPEKTSEYLRKKIINNYIKKQKIKKIVLSIIITANIVLVSTGITYANEIKGIVDNIISKRYIKKGTSSERVYIFTNSKKVLNYDANLKEYNCEIAHANSLPENDKCIYYSYDELEKSLGIKILNSDLFNKEHFLIKKLTRVDDKISSITLNLIKPINKDKLGSNTNLKFNVYINTKYSEESKIPVDEAEYDTEDIQTLFYINNLNIPVYGEKYGHFSKLWFEYDNIMYILDIYSSKRGNERNKEIQEILESLHY